MVAQDKRSRLLGRLVLIVDDDEDSLSILARVLQRMGAVVTTACSAEAALAEFTVRRTEFVITDYNMPGNDGIWLMANIRKLPAARGGQVPAILITGDGSPALKQRARNHGIAHYFERPVDAPTLTAALESLIS